MASRVRGAQNGSRPPKEVSLSTLNQRTKLSIVALMCCGVYTLPVLFGCANAVQSINRTTQKITDPLNGTVGRTNKIPPRTDAEKEDVKKAAHVTKKEGVDSGSDGALEQTDTFDIPRGWEVVNFTEENWVYQLKNEKFPDASLVVQYRDLGEGAASEQRERLIANHDSLTSRLPDSFQRVVFSETFENDRPVLHSRYRGQKGEGEPTMFINGYSVAISQDSFIVFAAYLENDDATLKSDVDLLIKSLRPIPTSEPTAEPTPGTPIDEEPPPPPAEPEG